MRNDSATGHLASDWRLARHDFHLALPASARAEPRPYPVAVPAGGPDPTHPAAARFLPLASTPPPARAQRLSTPTALATFGFHRLHEAVRACRRRERERERTTPEEHHAAEAAAGFIERLGASLSANDAAAVEVSWDSPRAPLPTRANAGPPRIRLRITHAGEAATDSHRSFRSSKSWRSAAPR